jgi:hypothetical protein
MLRPDGTKHGAPSPHNFIYGHRLFRSPRLAQPLLDRDVIRFALPGIMPAMEQHSKNLTVERLRNLPIHRDDETWEVAIISLPMPVMEKGDAEPWQPVCAACVSSRGGVMLSRPTKMPELAASSAVEAIASFASDPHTPEAKPLGYLPSRVHISAMPKKVQSHLTEALKSLGVEIEVKPELPMVNAFVQCITEEFSQMEGGPMDAPPLLKGKEMSVDRIRSFAEAAALFWEAAPWKLFDGETAWTITPRPKTRALSACVVMGGGGEEFGLGFLPSAIEVYGMEMRSMLGTAPVRPRGTLWSVMFDHVHGAPTADQELWQREQLPLANEEAFPIPIGFTESNRAMRPRADQLALMESLLRSFATITRDDAAKDELTFETMSYDGPVTLTLRCGARLE